jgi:hypothetical protein
MTDDQTSRVDPTGAADRQPTPPDDAAAPVAGTTPPAEPAEPAAGQPAATDAIASGSAGAAAASGGAAAASGGSLRWIVGLGVAGLALAVAIGAYLLLSGQPSPEALRYVPADAALVVEARFELPGDQLQKLGNLLAHFPGFDDQSTLSDKIDEGLSRLVGSSDPSIDYRNDIKPWLNGPAFFAVRPPAPGAEVGALENLLISVTTTGTVTCDRPFEGRTATHETYRGLDLFVDAESELACVIDGRQALLGDSASVKAGLDAKAAGTGMDRSERYRTARRALTGDQLGTVYIDGTRVRDLVPTPSLVPLPSLGAELPGLGGLDGFPGFGAIPDWVIGGIRAEDDALVLDTVTAPLPAPTAGAASLLPEPAGHASVLTGMLPANTLVLVEQQGVGVSIQNLVATLRADPEFARSLAVLDGLGGADDLFGWIDDAGIVVLDGSETPTAGLLLVAPDASSAAERVETLVGVLALAGLGGGLEVTESTVAGIEVTTVRITDLGSLIPPGTLPDGVEPPADAEVEFSLAARDRVILLGVGDGFMDAVLNVQPGASLADQAGYQQGVKRALQNSRTSVYIAVRDVVALVEGLLPEEAKGEWETDIRPYVAPIQVVSFSATSDAGGSRTRLTITVTEP